MAEPEKLDKELDKVTGGAGGDYPYMIVDKDLCICCGACISECPSGAISVIGETAYISPERCIACGTCMDVCPMRAISRV